MLNFRIILFNVSILFTATHSIFAQNTIPHTTDTITRRAPLLGLHLLLSDFQKPHRGHYNGGYQLSYFNSISSTLNYMIQAGSITSDEPRRNLNSTANTLIHYLQTSALLSLHDRQRIFDPFISMGVGLNYTHIYFTPYILPGAGIQVRVFKNTFFHLQANYELCLNNHISNSIQLNAGLLGAIFKSRKKVLQAHDYSKAFILSPSITEDIDTDHDGTPDSQDSCITIPGPKTFHGCPDSDGDGIPDHLDACPDIAGYQAYNGCPVPDRDHDGIPDDKDLCPDLPGIEKNNGCPVLNDQLKKKVNEIASRIHFAVNRYELTDSTKALLLEIIKVLKENPSLHLAVEGHTDRSGNALFNQKLSEQRAQSVADYIISNGINSQRVMATGYGDSKPKETNSTSEGKAANRRTELIISSFIS